MIHVHWHKYLSTLYENYLMHFDVRECRCGSLKFTSGYGYSRDKEYYELKRSLEQARKTDIHKLLQNKYR